MAFRPFAAAPTPGVTVAKQTDATPFGPPGFYALDADSPDDGSWMAFDFDVAPAPGALAANRVRVVLGSTASGELWLEGGTRPVFDDNTSSLVQARYGGVSGGSDDQGFFALGFDEPPAGADVGEPLGVNLVLAAIADQARKLVELYDLNGQQQVWVDAEGNANFNKRVDVDELVGWSLAEFPAGVVLRAPGGGRWLFTVDDAGDMVIAPAP